MDYTTHFNKRTSYKTNKALKNLFVFKMRENQEGNLFAVCKWTLAGLANSLLLQPSKIPDMFITFSGNDRF